MQDNAPRKDTRRQPTLFAMPPKPRRVLMRVADAGGHDAGWSEHRTKEIDHAE